MDTNWDDLKYLLAVVDCGTMSGAAELLDSNATKVSRRVRRLEAEFGFPLLERSGDGWRPTEASDPLVKTARRIKEAMASAEYDAVRRSTDLSGRLVISSMCFVNSLVLAHRCGDLIARHPQLEVQLDHTTKPQSLATGEADLALRTSRPTEGRLISRKLATFRIGIYQRLDAPRSERWLGLSKSMDDYPVMQHGYKHLAGPPAGRFNTLQTLASVMMATGLAGPLPSCVAASFPGLEPVLPDESFGENGLWMMYHESKRSDPRVQEAVTWLSDIMPNPRRCVCGRCN